jgi:hypothetical protein
MKRGIVAIGIVIGIAMAVGQVCGSDVRVSVSVSPSASVVGIPPSIEVEVTNLLRRAIQRPVTAALLVSPVDGREPFFARHLSKPVLAADPDWNGPVVSIEPGGESLLVFPADVSLRNPAWFLDRRMRTPGRYRLQVALIPTDYEHIGRFEMESTAPVMAEFAAAGYLSNAVEFTVIAPAGEDAEVCALVERHFNSAGCPVDRIDVDYALIKTIRTEYPHSAFTQFLLGRAPVGNGTRERIALYESAIATASAPAVADWYRLLLAGTHEREARPSPAVTEVQAEAHETAERALLQHLGAKSSVRALRNRANAKLKEMAAEENHAPQSH